MEGDLPEKRLNGCGELAVRYSAKYSWKTEVPRELVQKYLKLIFVDMVGTGAKVNPFLTRDMS